MSLDKAVQHGKEYRKPFRGTKKISKDCRNGQHNPCPYCEGNRRHNSKKKILGAKQQLDELKGNPQI